MRRDTLFIARKFKSFYESNFTLDVARELGVLAISSEKDPERKLRDNSFYALKTFAFDQATAYINYLILDNLDMEKPRGLFVKLRGDLKVTVAANDSLHFDGQRIFIERIFRNDSYTTLEQKLKRVSEIKEMINKHLDYQGFPVVYEAFTESDTSITFTIKYSEKLLMLRYIVFLRIYKFVGGRTASDNTVVVDGSKRDVSVTEDKKRYPLILKFSSHHLTDFTSFFHTFEDTFRFKDWSPLTKPKKQLN